MYKNKIIQIEGINMTLAYTYYDINIKLCATGILFLYIKTSQQVSLECNIW